MSANHEAGRSGTFILSDDDLGGLAEVMRKAGVRLLEVEGAGQRVRMTLEPSRSVLPAPVEIGAGEAPTLVKAASMGRFRAAHPDGLFPAGKLDAVVERGQILGFVQVGTLLLPVAAPRGGRLARILAADESLVGYGTPLFEIGHVAAPGARG